MYSSVYFKIKDNVGLSNRRVVDLFFRDWIDRTCSNQVQYTFVCDVAHEPGVQDILRVDFDYHTDATALKLKGVPDEFREYIELVGWPIDCNS